MKRKISYVLIAILTLLILASCDTEVKHEHKWDSGVITKEATCTEEGVMKFTCPCGKTKTEPIPMKPHSLADDKWTFDSASFMYIQECSVCHSKQQKAPDSGVRVQGIKGFEDKLYKTPAEAYTEINQFLSEAENGGLVQNGLSEEKFKNIFTRIVQNGEKYDAEIVWTIYGEQEMIEDTGHNNYLLCGRKAAHYAENLHVSKFSVIGGNDNAKLNCTNLVIPYEWWGGVCSDQLLSASFKDLAIDANGAKEEIKIGQAYNVGLSLAFDNCDITGKIYCYNNAKYTAEFNNCNFDSTNNGNYAIVAQGSESSEEKDGAIINIQNCTFKNFRGINIQQKQAVATIKGCTFDNCGNLSGEEKKNYYGILQLVCAKSILIEGNTIKNCIGNAIQLHHEKQFTGTLTVKDNVIDNCTYAFSNYGQQPFTLISSGNKISNSDIKHCCVKDGDEIKVVNVDKAL